VSFTQSPGTIKKTKNVYELLLKKPSNNKNKRKNVFALELKKQKPLDHSNNNRKNFYESRLKLQD
jgi:hypothetical protein